MNADECRGKSRWDGVMFLCDEHGRDSYICLRLERDSLLSKLEDTKLELEASRVVAAGFSGRVVVVELQVGEQRKLLSEVSDIFEPTTRRDIDSLLQARIQEALKGTEKQVDKPHNYADTHRPGDHEET